MKQEIAKKVLREEKLDEFTLVEYVEVDNGVRNMPLFTEDRDSPLVPVQMKEAKEEVSVAFLDEKGEVILEFRQSFDEVSFDFHNDPASFFEEIFE